MQVILLRTFNPKSKRVKSKQKCISNVPRWGNKNPLGTSLLLTLQPSCKNWRHCGCRAPARGGMLTPTSEILAKKVWSYNQTAFKMACWIPTLLTEKSFSLNRLFFKTRSRFHVSDLDLVGVWQLCTRTSTHSDTWMPKHFFFLISFI